MFPCKAFALLRECGLWQLRHSVGCANRYSSRWGR